MNADGQCRQAGLAWGRFCERSLPAPANERTPAHGCKGTTRSPVLLM